MLGILYLVLACFVGYNLLRLVFPGLFNLTKTTSLFGKYIKLDSWMITFPGSFLIGTLLLTWITYISSYLFKSASKPMFFGNIVSMSLFAVISVVFVVRQKEKFVQFSSRLKELDYDKIKTFFDKQTLEIYFIILVLAVTSFFMFRTFYISNGTMHIGLSVFSDFGPHLSVIRSFSMGSNFPTEYPHFADGHIRYHFLFQFLAGNMEFLGLRLDWAFNLPSILSLTSFFMLLYSFAVMLMGQKWIGIIASVLFFFRSSFAFFTYVAGMKTTSLGQIISNILRNDVHIGKTQHEEWGLWAQNVYVNQRHLAFSLGIFMLILIVMFPLFKKMVVALKKVRIKVDEEIKNEELNRIKLDEGQAHEEADTEVVAAPIEIKKQSRTQRYLKGWINEFLLKGDAWTPKDLKQSIVVGIILGAISFWNGAVVIAALPVLCVIALFSKHRLEFLNMAVIAAALSFAQTTVFIGASAVQPRLTIGFLAASPDIMGILRYYIELLGILPFVVIAGLLAVPKGLKWLALAFITPIILATTLQLTPDIAVNHKYVIISVILLNIIAAGFLYRLFNSGKIARAVATILLITMTITGVVDIITLYNMNGENRSVTIRVDDPLLVWTKNNAGPNEIFLTDAYCLNPILLAGRKIFYGWPYFTWSAGYDTGKRDIVVKEIYGGTDANTVKKLVKENNISYIVIEDGNRNSQDYKLNEELIKKTFKLAYEDNASRISVYRTY